jgi:hypothetical protein
VSTAAVDELIDLDAEVFEPPLCESHHCEIVRRRPPHEAHYYSRFPCCAFLYATCKDRVAEFGWQTIECDLCGAVFAGKDIVSIPIPSSGM